MSRQYGAQMFVDPYHKVETREQEQIHKLAGQGTGTSLCC